MGWHASWNFANNNQYKSYLYDRLGNLYSAYNERNLTWNVIWGIYTHTPLEQPDNHYRDTYSLGAYSQLGLLKTAVKTMLNEGFGRGWFSEVEIAKSGTLKQWMDANTIITDSTYSSSPYTKGLPIHTNSTLLPVVSGSETIASIMTDLGLPTNYLDYTPYRGLYEPCGIPDSADVEAGFDLWDYNEYGLYLIFKNMIRWGRDWSGSSIRQFDHAEADGRSCGSEQTDLHYADMVTKINDDYPNYAWTEKLPRIETYTKLDSSGFYRGLAQKTGQCKADHEFNGTGAVGYPIDINWYPIYYSMGGTTALDTWEGFWTKLSYEPNSLSFTYNPVSGLTLDEWDTLTGELVSIDGDIVASESSGVGQSGSVQPSQPSAPSLPVSGYNINVASGGAHQFCGWRLFHVYEPVLEYV